MVNKTYNIQADIEGLIARLKKQTNINTVRGSLKPLSVYSDNFELPVIVEGTLITAREYDDGIIPADELKKAHKGWEGKTIWKYHGAYWNIYDKDKETPIDAMVGKILKTWWDKATNSIKYIGEIYDRDVAYKIYEGLIRSVSVGFLNEHDENDQGEKIKIDIEPKELSLVVNPKDKDASIKIKRIKFNK